MESITRLEEDCTTTEPPSLLGTQQTIMPTAQTPPTLIGTQATVLLPASSSPSARNLATWDGSEKVDAVSVVAGLATTSSPSRPRLSARGRLNEADGDGVVLPATMNASPSVSWCRDDSTARARASQQTPVLRFPLAPDSQRLGVAPYSASSSPPPQSSRPLMWSPPLSAAHAPGFRMTPGRQTSPRHDQQSPYRHGAPTSSVPQWPSSAVAVARSLQESRHTSSQPIFPSSLAAGQSQPVASWHWQSRNQSQGVAVTSQGVSGC